MLGKGRLADAARRQAVFVSHWNLFHPSARGSNSPNRGLAAAPGNSQGFETRNSPGFQSGGRALGRRSVTQFLSKTSEGSPSDLGTIWEQ